MKAHAASPALRSSDGGARLCARKLRAVSCCCGILLATLMTGCDRAERARATGTTTPRMEASVRRDATVRAVELVMPSVVNIATATVKSYPDFYDPIFQQFYGRQREELYNIGSGVIIDESGYILSNWHVMQRATRAQVKLWNGRVYEVESYTYSSSTDLALLKLRTKPGEKFTAIKFAANDDLLLGETVLALGNPFGLGGSVSQGILSSKNRRGPLAEVAPGVQEWLQTDAAINPGNSGGPLVNLNGELIGVNSAVGEGQGISFAIPVKQAVQALAELLSPETTDFLWFGARVLPDRGVLKVDLVQPGSPAANAGLQAGQEIMQVAGKPVGSLVALNRLLVANPGQEISLQVRQAGKTSTLKAKPVPFAEMIRHKLGLVFSSRVPENAARFGINNGEGLIIEDVQPDGPAARVQIQRDYLLTGIDGKSARDLLTVANAIAAKPTGASVQLNVWVPRRLEDNSVEFRQAVAAVQVR